MYCSRPVYIHNFLYCTGMGRSALPTHVGPGLGPTLMCCVEDVGSKVMFGSYNLFMYLCFHVSNTNRFLGFHAIGPDISEARQWPAVTR